MKKVLVLLGLTFAGIATVMTVHLSLPWMDRITGWKYDAVMIGDTS